MADNEDLEESYGNILSAYVLDNTKMKNKCDIVASNIPLFVRSTNSNYLEDYPIIAKMDNPEVIKNFIIQSLKEGNNIILKDIPNKPTDVYSSKMRKQEASVVLKDVQKSSNRRFIEKEVGELVASTIIIHSKTKNGKSPKKATSVSVISESPLRKKMLRNLYDFEEEEEEQNVFLIRKKKGANGFVQKKAIKPSLKIAQLLASIILDQQEKHQEASVSKDQEAIIGILEPVEVQDAEVIVSLKDVETYVVSKEVVPKTAT